MDSEDGDGAKRKAAENSRCEEGYRRGVIKKYLFMDKAGAELDEEMQKVKAHICGNTCLSCANKVDEITAAEPYLRGDEPSLPPARIEIIRKRPIVGS